MSDLMGLAEAGTLRPDDLVWRAGMPGWVAASTVQGLFPPPVVPPMPPPLPPAGTGVVPVAQTGNGFVGWAISKAASGPKNMMSGLKQAADETGISGLFGR